MSKDKVEINSARLHDGWKYAVNVRGEGKIPLADHDPLASILARWMDTRLTKVLLEFSGAREQDEDGEISGVELSGAVVAQEILAIRYWHRTDDDFSEQAIEAAQAHLAIQAAALARTMEQSEGEQDGEDDEQQPAPVNEAQDAFKPFA